VSTNLNIPVDRELPSFVGLGDTQARFGSPNHDSGRDSGRDSGTDGGGQSLGELTYLTADNRDLRAELDRLRAERDRLLATQARIMEVLGSTVPERLLHDLRNVLNERELFKALADTVE